MQARDCLQDSPSRKISALPGILQVAVVDRSGEGDNIPNVAHTGQVHHAPLKSETEAGVAGRAIFSQVQVKAVILFPEAQFVDAAQEDIITILPLAAADDLTDAGHQTIHSRYRFSIRV